MNRLFNLKSLEIDSNEKNNFELISNSFNQLTTFKLKHKTIDFPQLKCLQIRHIDLSKQIISQQSFNGMINLIELYLHSTNLKNIDFIYTDLLSNLEILILSYNQISVLKKGIFSKLKNLKHLALCGNRIKVLLPNTFDDLDCLEVLAITYLQLFCYSIII